MNKKYLIAKTAAIFFSITTVVLFVMSREGILFAVAGTNFGVLLYISNFVLLMIAFVIFIWQRAAYNNSRLRDNLEILEHISTDTGPNSASSASMKISVDKTVFLTLSKAGDTQEVTVSTKPEFAAIRKGEAVEVVSSQNQTLSLRALVVEINHDHVLLRKLPHVKE